MKNYYVILSILLLQLLAVQDVSAGYCVSRGDGLWNDPLNWTCGRVPGSGDTIIISPGDSILVQTSVNGLTGIWLQVYGWLEFPNATRLVMEYGDTAIPPSMVTFYSGSGCYGGNGSSGISFGAGGSGCDIYRPGQGANPGVYPTIPGSYYDGCVWAAYLPITDLHVDISVVNQEMNIYWSLYENSFISHYEVVAYIGDQEVPLDIIPSQEQGSALVEYFAKYPVAGLNAIKVIGHQHNNSQIAIAYGIVNQLVPVILGDVSSKPNPFDKYFEVQSKFSFDVQVYSIDGQLLYEGNGQNYYNINTEQFTSGLYQVVFTKNNQVIDRKKIVKL